MSLVVNNTTITSFKVKNSSAAAAAVPYAMARDVQEKNYKEYNWKYVHVEPGRLLENVLSVDVNRNLNIYKISLPSGKAFNANTTNRYHIIMGYSSGSCHESIGGSSWVDIIAYYNGVNMDIDKKGPMANSNMTIELGKLENNGRTLPITVFFPVVWTADSGATSYYKFHGLYVRSS